MRLTVGSLFAGIGGIDLGLERAGMEVIWQVESDGYARRVLEKHWPAVQRYGDVRYFLGGKRWRKARAAWEVDLIAGGFPCQDISNAGRRAGIDGSRSGLWSEFARIVRLLRPTYVFVENVPALTIRGLGQVLGDLAALGFDAEWGCFPAAALGAPHERWRLFIVAYRGPGPLAVRDDECDAATVQWQAEQRGEPDGTHEVHPSDANRQRKQQPERTVGDKWRWASNVRSVNDANANGSGRQVSQQVFTGQRHAYISREAFTPESASLWAGQRWRCEFAEFCESQGRLLWPDAQPGVCGVAHGVPRRVHRLRGLGNAVMPQFAEWIGRRIIAAMN